MTAPVIKELCERCGKLIRISNPFHYVYKRKPRNRILYFCGWTCMKRWDEDGKVWSRTIEKDF